MYDLCTAACAARGLSAYESLCCTFACPSTRSFVLHLDMSAFRVPVLHLCVSVYKSFVLHLYLSVYNSLCCFCAFLFTRDLCCTWTCLSTTACAAPVHVCLQQPSPSCTSIHLFRFVLVCFGLFRYMFEIMKQTETNRKILSLVSWNKPKNNRNKLSFGSFRFKPKIFFVVSNPHSLCIQHLI